MIRIRRSEISSLSLSLSLARVGKFGDADGYEFPYPTLELLTCTYSRLGMTDMYSYDIASEPERHDH